MLRITLAVILLLTLGNFNTKRSLTYNGIASDLESGEIYFTEHHEEYLSDSQSTELTEIEYRNPAGEIIVKKRIDYSRNHFCPDFMQEDVRDGYIEGAKVNGEEIELIYRKNKKKSIQRKKIKIPSPAVVDGGFNYFLKSHWNELIKGEQIRFNFAVPSQLTYYSFRVFKIREEMVNQKKIIVFKMEPDALLLRMLLPPILLNYNVETKRLMQYQGITTINDVNGKSFKVKIIYPITGP